MDSKFGEISQELSKLRNENVQLKEREKLLKRKLREQEEESEELREKASREKQRAEEVNVHVVEMEREIRTLMEEREREAKDQEQRAKAEQRLKDENKGVVLGDIHNMIRNYKDEKKQQKSGFIANTNALSSQNTSAYYS